MPQKIRFNADQYRFSHGKAPRGRGSWAFATHPHPSVRDVWFSPGNMLLGQAKEWAASVARDRLLDRHVTLYILP